MLVDSHCHLDFPELADEIDAIITRAQAAGVGAMVTISTHTRRFATYAAIANAHPAVFCTVGTHPHHAGEEADVSAEELTALARHPRCIGIGEAGLDYHYDSSPRDLAARVFAAHIEAARRAGLPLVIHARDADADMSAILREETDRGAFKAVLHCYSSGPDLARLGVELGFLLSFSGILTFKRSDELRAIAAGVPLDQLLVETDAPYLAPQRRRGRRNEPAFVAETAEMLAGLKGVSPDELALATTRNFFRYFDKAAPPS